MSTTYLPPPRDPILTANIIPAHVRAELRRRPLCVVVLGDGGSFLMDSFCRMGLPVRYTAIENCAAKVARGYAKYADRIIRPKQQDLMALTEADVLSWGRQDACLSTVECVDTSPAGEGKLVWGITEQLTKKARWVFDVLLTLNPYLVLGAELSAQAKYHKDLDTLLRLPCTWSARAERVSLYKATESTRDQRVSTG